MELLLIQSWRKTTAVKLSSSTRTIPRQLDCRARHLARHEALSSTLLDTPRLVPNLATLSKPDHIVHATSSSSEVAQQHEPLLNVTLSQLASPRPVVRKRAGTTIGVLATVISDTLLHRLVERILDQIDQAEGLGKSGKKRARKAHKGGVMASEADLRSADTRSLIRTMCTVSGTVGQRLNQGHIDRSEYSHPSLSEVVFVWGFQKVPFINLSFSILLTCHVLTSLHSNSFSCPHFPTFL